MVYTLSVLMHLSLSAVGLCLCTGWQKLQVCYRTGSGTESWFFSFFFICCLPRQVFSQSIFHHLDHCISFHLVSFLHALFHFSFNFCNIGMKGVGSLAPPCAQIKYSGKSALCWVVRKVYQSQGRREPEGSLPKINCLLLTSVVKDAEIIRREGDAWERMSGDRNLTECQGAAGVALSHWGGWTRSCRHCRAGRTILSLVGHHPPIEAGLGKGTGSCPLPNDNQVRRGQE